MIDKNYKNIVRDEIIQMKFLGEFIVFNLDIGLLLYIFRYKIKFQVIDLIMVIYNILIMVIVGNQVNFIDKNKNLLGFIYLNRLVCLLIKNIVLFY